MKKLSLITSILCFAVGVIAQVDPSRELTSTAERIAALRDQINDLTEATPSEDALVQICKHNCADASRQLRSEARQSRRRREDRTRRAIAALNQEIDAYISAQVDPGSVDQMVLKHELGRLLGEAEVSAVFADNDILIVAYEFNLGELMGPSATIVTIRAYKVAQGHFRFTSATGQDMDGFARLSLQELHFSKPQERWVLVSGYLTGANGPLNGMRLYAYDGLRFRTAWTSNTWGNFTATVTPNGFTVDGEYYRTNKRRYETYLVTVPHILRLKTFLSPNGQSSAIIKDTAVSDARYRESMISILRTDGTVLASHNFTSSDGQHGAAMLSCGWSPDSQYFIGRMSHTGGHQPEFSPIVIWSAGTQRLYELTTYTAYGRLSMKAPTRLPVLTWPALKPTTIDLKALKSADFRELK